VTVLQQQNLLHCVVNRNDRRSVLVSSTSNGRTALRKGLVHTLERVAALLSRLDTSELEAMAMAIRRARDRKGES